MLPIYSNCKISDSELYRIHAVNHIEHALSLFNENKTLIKTASGDNKESNLIELFAKMIAALNIKSSEAELQEFFKKLSSNNDEMNKYAKQNKTSQERKDDIKIVSKSVKDSHYQVDISKDFITKNGNKVIMVSCFAKDAYLGRYLIKRNFLYTIAREKYADQAYDEILTKISAIKDRYYNEVIDVSTIFAQIKQTLDGVVSEIKMEEDSISTNINRNS